MAKPLVFLLNNQTFSLGLSKIDRSVLYGFKEVEVLDEHGGRCELATLADDGCTILGRGGTAFASVAPDGVWCEKAALKPVDLDGKEIQPVPSSFSAPIPLSETASVNEYLAHNIRSVYLLRGEGDVSALIGELTRRVIFKFAYSYRGGLEADVGFLLAGADGNAFLAVGTPTRTEFVGLQQDLASPVEEEGSEGETDLLDFDMI